MSIQSQAILIRSLAATDVTSMIETMTGCKAIIRPTHNATYQLIEFEGPAGPECLHLFLESSVSDDYADVTDQPSTFVSAQLSPFASATVRQLAEAFGGFFRRTEQDPWESIHAKPTS